MRVRAVCRAMQGVVVVVVVVAADPALWPLLLAGDPGGALQAQ